MKEHKSLIILFAFIFLTLCGLGVYINKPILSGLSIVVAFVVYLKTRNQMMAYIENHAYDGHGQ